MEHKNRNRMTQFDLVPFTMPSLLSPRLIVSTCLVFSLAFAKKTANKSASSLPSQAWNQARRMANLGNLFGSARVTAKTPYERVGSHPVFQVTTSWGAPYMSFEKIDTGGADESATNLLGYGGDMRPVTLFYMDPEDALAMHQEMKQMENMIKSDIRITATTLAKAIRQASNFGDGLPTGTPIDPLTGKLPSVSDGGSLRYKIVPSKRQLFYAARCAGRERVGQFSDNPADDAGTVLDGNQALDAINQGRRRDVRNGKSKAFTPDQRKYRHMEGYLGIPVFYCPALRRKLPVVKGLLGGTREENPLFFSYEDMLDAWNTMRKRDQKAPVVPPNVEVMNLMDVLASMDRESSAPALPFDLKDPVGSIAHQFHALKRSITTRFSGPDLDAISFIPSGAAVHYKEVLAARGNGKSRLPRMRDWGPRTAK